MLAFPKGRLQLSIHVPQVAIATWGGRNGKGPPTICSMHGGYRPSMIPKSGHRFSDKIMLHQ